MAMNVVSLFDVHEQRQHMFAVDESILIKDAVMAFLEKTSEHFGLDKADIQNLQTQISASTSMEDLSSILVGFDFLFAMLQVD